MLIDHLYDQSRDSRLNLKIFDELPNVSGASVYLDCIYINVCL